MSDTPKDEYSSRRWVSVKDQLPHNERVVIVFGGSHYWLTQFRGGKCDLERPWLVEPTHWTELPDSPSKDISHHFTDEPEHKSAIYLAEQWGICKEALNTSNQKAEHLQERLDRMIETNDTLDQTVCHLRDRLKTYTTLAGNGQ